MARTNRLLAPLLSMLALGALLANAGVSRADAAGQSRGHKRPATSLRSRLPSRGLDPLRLRQAPDESRTGASSAPMAPRTAGVLTGFSGVADGHPYVSPSDATGAAGPNFILAAANVHAEVFDRSGVALAGPFRLKSMFGDLPSGIDTDPKVVYDGYGHHFILVYLVYNNSQDYIVVVTIPESTADQKSTWCHWVYNGDQISGDGHQFADYPGLGFTANHVTITTNNFPFTSSGYDYAQILSFKKAALYQTDCSPMPTPTVFGGSATRDPDGSKAFTIQPAQTIGGTDPTLQYMASFDWNGSRVSDLVLWRLRFVNSRPQLVRVAMRVFSVAFPPYGGQCGGTGGVDSLWDTGDLRLTGAFFDADLDRLYTANAMSHQFGSGSDESAVRWYEVDPAVTLANSAITRNAYVGRDGYDAAWPSVATNAGGVLFVNYSEASVAHAECLSFLATTVEPGVTQNTGPTLVKGGEGRYRFNADVQRWGDFSAINRDPADGSGSTMAAFNAYAYNPASQATTISWAEWVALLDDV